MSTATPGRYPRKKWIKILRKMLGGIPDLSLQPGIYPYRYQVMKQAKPQGRIRDNKQDQPKRKAERDTGTRTR